MTKLLCGSSWSCSSTFHAPANASPVPTVRASQPGSPSTIPAERRKKISIGPGDPRQPRRGLRRQIPPCLRFGRQVYSTSLPPVSPNCDCHSHHGNAMTLATAVKLTSALQRRCCARYAARPTITSTPTLRVSAASPAQTPATRASVIPPRSCPRSRATSAESRSATKTTSLSSRSTCDSKPGFSPPTSALPNAMADGRPATARSQPHVKMEMSAKASALMAFEAIKAVPDEGARTFTIARTADTLADFVEAGLPGRLISV